MPSTRFNYLETKWPFIIALIVMTVTILGVWLYGIQDDRSLYHNSLISTTLLSGFFFLFVTIGLYDGVKLKDNLGKVLEQKNFKSFTFSPDGFDFVGGGDDIISAIFMIILSIVVAFIISLIMAFLSAALWIVFLAVMAMLYWVFFRALRWVFKKSPVCQGKWGKSLLYSLGFTLLYSCWIYGLIILVFTL